MREVLQRRNRAFGPNGVPTTSRQTSATRTDTTSRLPISLGSTNKRYEPSSLPRPGEFSLNLQNGAGFDERLDPVLAVFPADAGVFEAAPGCLRIVRHAVDDDAAGSQLGGDAAGALEVGPEDGTVEAIPGVVGDPDGLLLRVVSNHAKHRAENLLPGDRHVVLHVDKYRGLREETRVET